MVAVPEVPDEPALVPETLAAAGYFESVAVTGEDRERGAQYAENAKREQRARATRRHRRPISRASRCSVVWGYFDTLNRQRIVQLINKTNQFNLTTRRYSENDYDAFMRDDERVGLHVRLVDRFGDNGLIAVVIGKFDGDGLSDRHLADELPRARPRGRGGDAVVARRRGAPARRARLIGEYAPSPKNGMVREHYEKLGFDADRRGRRGAESGWRSKSRPTVAQICRWCWKGRYLDKQARILEEITPLLRDIFAREDLVVDAGDDRRRRAWLG